MPDSSRRNYPEGVFALLIRGRAHGRFRGVHFPLGVSPSENIEEPHYRTEVPYTIYRLRQTLFPFLFWEMCQYVRRLAMKTAWMHYLVTLSNIWYICL